MNPRKFTEKTLALSIIFFLDNVSKSGMWENRDGIFGVE